MSQSQSSASELKRFFILTYTITWISFGAFVLCWKFIYDEKTPSWLYFLLLGGYGPTIAAIYLSRKNGGPGAVKRLFSKILIWRVSVVWYLFVLAIPLILYAMAMVLSDTSMASLHPISWNRLSASIPGYLLAALPFGPLAEELGWRGYAMPKLLKRWTPVKASIILGIIWTFWHTPLFWFPGATFPPAMEVSMITVLLYLFMTIAEAIIFTFVLLRTRGSVLLAILFHLMLNASSNILYAGLPSIDKAQRIDIWQLHTLLIVVLALICALFMRKKTAITSS